MSYKIDEDVGCKKWSFSFQPPPSKTGQTPATAKPYAERDLFVTRSAKRLHGGKASGRKWELSVFAQRCRQRTTTTNGTCTGAPWPRGHVLAVIRVLGLFGYGN